MINKICGIYKIISPSGRIYIGQSIDINNRFYNYRYPSYVYKQKRLANSFKKYGYINHVFEIIEECDFNELNKRERYWQDYYNVLDSNGLNCVLQDTSIKPKRLSEETKAKMRLKKVSEETREKMIKSCHLSKIVLDLETGIYYNSAKEASEIYNVKHSTLRDYLQGKYPNKTNLRYV